MAKVFFPIQMHLKHPYLSLSLSFKLFVNIKYKMLVTDLFFCFYFLNRPLI